MKRGEVWTAAGGADYAGKPRPVVIVQDDRFDETDSVTICSLTSDSTDAYIFRVAIEASVDNGLRSAWRAMVDKLTTLPRRKLGRRIGQLNEGDLRKVDEAILVFLGLDR